MNPSVIRARRPPFLYSQAICLQKLQGGAGAYDVNNDEKISRDEALAAIADYYRGAIAREHQHRSY